MNDTEKKEMELLREQAMHNKTFRYLEHREQLLSDMLDAVQDITGEFYGDHNNDNCPWENAINALQEMADEKHRVSKQAHA